MSTLVHSPALRAAANPQHRRWWIGAAIALGAFVGLVGALAGLGFDGSSASQAEAAAAARGFLHHFVEADGRVVRRDQGGDSVSEGQAYGLLLAQSVGDDGAFSRIWDWTRTHLQRPDGLLASLSNPAGAVRDPTPASDADVLAAWALSMASGPDAPYYHAQARRLANALLTAETTTRGGLLMLAAGPWATGNPVSLNPSYWSLDAFEALGRFTGDPRWAALSQSSYALTEALSAHGRSLPPDWARVDGTIATPTPAPDGQARQTQYGLDAQRLVVWLAASCQRGPRQLAAKWWTLLASPSHARALALAPDGSVVDSATNAMPIIAAAAAASASGHQVNRDRLLDAAARVQASHPTYYGAAWLALGRMLLTTTALGGCAAKGAP
jgi:endo-1,4-beta-D-glucanase Y